MSTVQQLLNVLKKTFYDLTPVSNKQMSLMSMANGGIGFCKYEAKALWTITQFCTAGINHGGPSGGFVTSQISTGRKILTSSYGRLSSELIFVNIFVNVFDRPLSRGGHFESQGNKKLCFCTSSLALNERLAVRNLLFEHCVIKER